MLFKLVSSEFNDQYNEQWWVYSCLFLLLINGKKINKITITDHWQQKQGRETITNELICEIIKERLNRKIIKPANYFGSRIVYIEEKIDYQGKKYKLVFWFENDHPDWMWVRNCHRQN